MGDLNNIQDEIFAEMSGDLADVSFPYTGSREIRNPIFDPENPEPTGSTTYNWSGIFGLSFTIKDTEVFQIQAKDQKGIVFMRNGALNIPYEPQIQEVIEITYKDESKESFTIIDMAKIPAGNGYVLQMRKYG